MDSARFDAVTRRLAAGGSRRSLVTGVGRALGVLVLGRRAPVSAAQGTCRGIGAPCTSTMQCCLGLVCAPNGTCQDARELLTSRSLPGATPATTLSPTTTPTATPTTTPPPTQPPTTAAPAPPPATQPPTTATSAPGPAITPTPLPSATLRVVAAICPPGLRAVTPTDFAQACGRPAQRANGLTLRLTGPVTATRITGDRGQAGETVFADLPPGPVTLQIPPPPAPATIYAFCGTDPAAPAVQQLSTGRQPGSGHPVGLQLTAPLAPGQALTCATFTVPDELSATTGALLVQAAACAPGATPPATGVPGASCARPASGAQFVLTRVPEATATPMAIPPSAVTGTVTGTTDADGLLRFGRLAPGRYHLTPPRHPLVPGALRRGGWGGAAGRARRAAGRRLDLYLRARCTRRHACADGDDGPDAPRDGDARGHARPDVLVHGVRLAGGLLPSDRESAALGGALCPEHGLWPGVRDLHPARRPGIWPLCLESHGHDE